MYSLVLSDKVKSYDNCYNVDRIEEISAGKDNDFPIYNLYLLQNDDTSEYTVLLKGIHRESDILVNNLSSGRQLDLVNNMILALRKKDKSWNFEKIKNSSVFQLFNTDEEISEDMLVSGDFINQYPIDIIFDIKIY